MWVSVYMVRIEDLFRRYWERRAEAMEKIDWDVMNKHLHTDHARRVYRVAKRDVYQYICSTSANLAEESKVWSPTPVFSREEYFIKMSSFFCCVMPRYRG